MRHVFRVHRHKLPNDELEDWVDFSRRAKHRVEELADQMSMQDWVHIQRRRKWQFAGKVARQQDGRLSRQILEWRPNCGHGRSQGRPKTRWADQLGSFAGGDWMDLALNADDWDIAEEAFVNAL